VGLGMGLCMCGVGGQPHCCNRQREAASREALHGRSGLRGDPLRVPGGNLIHRELGGAFDSGQLLLLGALALRRTYAPLHLSLCLRRSCLPFSCIDNFALHKTSPPPPPLPLLSQSTQGTVGYHWCCRCAYFLQSPLPSEVAHTVKLCAPPMRL